MAAPGESHLGPAERGLGCWGGLWPAWQCQSKGREMPPRRHWFEDDRARQPGLIAAPATPRADRMSGSNSSGAPRRPAPAAAMHCEIARQSQSTCDPARQFL
jgi:hypothetical protein